MLYYLVFWSDGTKSVIPGMNVKGFAENGTVTATHDGVNYATARVLLTSGKISLNYYYLIHRFICYRQRKKSGVTSRDIRLQRSDCEETQMYLLI